MPVIVIHEGGGGWWHFLGQERFIPWAVLTHPRIDREHAKALDSAHDWKVKATGRTRGPSI